MDASLYKDYILTLLFVKYVSDRAGQPDALIEVPPGCSFDDMKKLRGSKDIGEKMDTIISKIAEANDLTGIIDRAHFNNAERFGAAEAGSKKLTALINIFSREELNFSKNRADGDDILGDAYEYLMRNFATNPERAKASSTRPPRSPGWWRLWPVSTEPTASSRPCMTRPVALDRSSFALRGRTGAPLNLRPGVRHRHARSRGHEYDPSRRGDGRDRTGRCHS